MNAGIIEHFSSLKDPRIERHKKHELIDIIVLSVCAVCSGANGWEAIEEFGHEKLQWLRQFVPLTNGVPSHDCMCYVLCAITLISIGLSSMFYGLDKCRYGKLPWASHRHRRQDGSWLT